MTPLSSGAVISLCRYSRLVTGELCPRGCKETHCTASMDLKEISTSKHFGFAIRKQRPRQSRRAKSERRRGPRHSWPNLQLCVVMVIIFQNIVIRASEINKVYGGLLTNYCTNVRLKGDNCINRRQMGSMMFQQLEALSLGPGGVKLFTTERFAVAPIQKLPIQWDRNLTHFEVRSKAWQLWAFGNVKV